MDYCYVQAAVCENVLCSNPYSEYTSGNTGLETTGASQTRRPILRLYLFLYLFQSLDNLRMWIIILLNLLTMTHFVWKK